MACLNLQEHGEAVPKEKWAEMAEKQLEGSAKLGQLTERRLSLHLTRVSVDRGGETP